MKIEIDKDSCEAIENLCRYITCILPKRNLEVKLIRKGRKQLCKSLEIIYNVKDEIES